MNRTASNLSNDAPAVLSELVVLRQLRAATANPKSEVDLCRLFAASASSGNSREFRQYALEVLEDTYLPKTLSAESRQGSFSWVYGLPDLTRTSTLLDTSLLAFCLSQFIVTGNGNTSLYTCLGHYNVALQHLALDLDDPDRRLQEETLAAIVVLSTCEVHIDSCANYLASRC